MLTHKYGFTPSFVKKIKDHITNGLSFSLLQATYIENQLERCARRREQFENHCDLYQKLLEKSLEDETMDSVDSQFDDYQTFLINLFPSDDLLCDIFWKYFTEKRALYEHAMRKITAKSLMADHTFKVI